LHLLRGNASKKSLNELSDAVEPTVEIPNCPSFLLPAAKREWKRITPLLEELGLIAKIDMATVGIYCSAVAWWGYHEDNLKRAVQEAADARAVWEKDPANAGKLYAGGDGFTLPTPNGSFQYNPHWVGRNKAMEQIDKFAATFGGGAAFRSRVTPSSNYPYLPGLEPNKDDASAKPTAKITSLADFARAT
jgi:phage terminase small subunit